MLQRQLSLIHQFRTTTRQHYHGRFGLVPNHLRAELSQVQNRDTAFRGRSRVLRQPWQSFQAGGGGVCNPRGESEGIHIIQ